MSKSLFDKIYASGAEALKMAKKGIVRNSLQSKFRTLAGSVADQGVKSVEEIIQERGKLGTSEYDPSKIVKAKAEAADAQRTFDMYKEEYEVTFGEELSGVSLNVNELIEALTVTPESGSAKAQ